MFGFRIKAVSYWFDSSLFSHTAMERRVAVAARPAEVVWIESLMGYIETGMDPEVKTQLQEISADRHEIFSKRLAEKFQNPSPGWLAHAGLLDTQHPRLKAVWWVFYFDKQLCDKAKKSVTMLHYGAASRQAWRQRSKLCFEKRQKIVMRSFAGA